MPRPREGRPDLRLIEGGLAHPRDAATATRAPSPSSKSGARTGGIIHEVPLSPCDPTPTKPVTREVKVLVCGSRTWTDHIPVLVFLAGWQATNPGCSFRVAHGNAQGADTYGGDAAEVLGMTVEKFPANWTTHGKRAGFLRNKQMIDEFKPDIVLAFSESPISKGTAHTVRLAKAANIPVYVIGHGDDAA